MKKLPLHLLIPVLFIAFVILAIPFGKLFEFDSDEGINIMKSLLYSEGFSLYKDIWSDQPPLFTFILSGWFKIWGESIFAARSLVLLFSALLVWCFYQILRRDLGIFSALAGVLILVNSHYYIQLSVSVMIGMPCIALGVLAVYFLAEARHSHRKRRFLIVISGFVLALSLQIKLLTIFLIPLLCLQIADFSTNHFSRKLLNIYQWLLTIVVTYLSISLFFGSLTFKQLLQPHLSARNTVEIFSNYHNLLPLLERMFGQDYLFYLLAMMGTIIILTTRNKSGLFPLAWLGSVCLLLANHHPVWYHHYLLISLPLAWLAAYGVNSLEKLWQNLRQRSKHFYTKGLSVIYVPTITKKRSISRTKLSPLIISILVALLSLGSVALESYRFWNKQDYFQKRLMRTGHNDRQTVVNLILQHKEQTKWIFTDKPIYAFYGELKVPPEIAVLSLKRVLTGTITKEEMLEIIKNYQPEQILLTKFRYTLRDHPPTKEYLERHYVKVYDNNLIDVDYYLLKQLDEFKINKYSSSHIGEIH